MQYNAFRQTQGRMVAIMAHLNAKKLFPLFLALALCLTSVNALACTAVYVGSDLTADGTTMFARSEDISNSYNKLFYAIPAGVHTAGEVYNGCYGFTYTFTKDSYAYTAFRDDNGAAKDGVCPDCGQTHAHTPYEAGGTNSMGVSVSATETIGCSDAMYEVDPYTDEGIEEAEITTVLLSESATAKEAVELLLSIYDSVGAAGGSGIFIADDKEVWYVENASGTQYVAVKLTSTMAFSQPNMSVIGLIDLDDTENVMASANLIAVAEQAGSYVGDKEANTIDYAASYNADQGVGSRMVNALKYFNAATAKEEPDYADFAISNVAALSVFVPYYPMLTTDTYAGYQLSTAAADFVEAQPESGVYYATTKNKRNENGERVKVEGFCVLPENWANSVYWTMDALSNLYEYGTLTDEEKAQVETTLADLQAECYEVYNQLKADPDNATAISAAAAQKVHEACVALVNAVK